MLIASILVDYEYTLIMYTIADFIKNMGFVLIKSRLEKSCFYTITSNFLPNVLHVTSQVCILL